MHKYSEPLNDIGPGWAFVCGLEMEGAAVSKVKSSEEN